jgi:hypothetical protein
VAHQFHQQLDIPSDNLRGANDDRAIVDETEKIARAYEHSPGAAPFYKDRDQTIAAPIRFVPTEMVMST